MLEKISEKKFLENKIPKKVIIPKENQKSSRKIYKKKRKKRKICLKKFQKKN